MTVSKLQINISQIRLVQIVFVAIIVSILSYVYLINSLTFSIAQKQEITEQVSILNSEISDLELKIIEEKKNINKELAQEMGLTQEIENKTLFVLRDNTRLTFNE